MPVGAHVTIKGKVQGVYFRMSVQEQARARGVTGWVRNLPDGGVELLAQGERTAVEGLIAWCRQGPPRARVNDLVVRWKESAEGQSDFAIRG